MITLTNTRIIRAYLDYTAEVEIKDEELAEQLKKYGLKLEKERKDA